MFNLFFRWDDFVFPKVARIIYYVGLVVIALGTLAGVINGVFVGSLGSTETTTFASISMVVGALIGGVLAVLVWRIIIELWMVLFSIHDVLKEIRDRSGA